MAYPAEAIATPRNMSGLRSRVTIGTVGITDYAQNSLGDIVFVELPKVRCADPGGSDVRLG